MFGIDSPEVTLVIQLLILLIVILYVSLVVWVYLDARRRIDDKWFIGYSVLLGLIPFIGPMVYAILRPPELREERREREAEMRETEMRLHHLEESSCPNCAHPVENDYLRCPACRTRLKHPCQSCDRPVSPRWTVCPYCEAPIAARRAAEGRAAAAPARAKRASARTDKPARGKEPATATARIGEAVRRTNAEKASGTTRPASSSASASGTPARKPAGSTRSSRRSPRPKPPADSAQ